MKKWKFALTSLVCVGTLPISIISSCNSTQTLSNYQWKINEGYFTYQLISDQYGEDFKIEITANSGYGINVEQSTLYIGNTKKTFELHDGILTIPASAIKNKVIKINVVSVLTPETISLTYGKEGKTDPITIYSGIIYSSFKTAVVPEAAADNVVCKSSYPNVAKFIDNVLYPIATGEVDIWVESVGYKTEIKSNTIHVTVAPSSDTNDIDDTDVPEKIDCVTGKNKVGFLFRGFKANFNIKKKIVTPKIILPDGDMSQPSISITNIVNDNFDKSTFDIHVEYNKNDYDNHNHAFNVEFTIEDELEPIVSKQLIMQHSAVAKTVIVTDVTTTSKIVNLSEAKIKGFKTNFSFDPDGYDRINFISNINNWTIKSTQFNVVSTSQDKTIFDASVFVDGELEDGPLIFDIYLNDTFICNLTVQLNVGDIVWNENIEAIFYNGDKPYLIVDRVKTNFDFRVPGETGADDKPLLTIQWSSVSPVPAPDEIIIEHVEPEPGNNDIYTFQVTFNWNQKVDVSGLADHYLLYLEPLLDGQPVENNLFLISFLLNSIKPYRLITDLVKTDDQQKIYINDFLFSGLFDSKDLDYIFKSNDGLPKPDIQRTTDDNTGITYADGHYVTTLELDWKQQVVDLSTPKHFTLEIKNNKTGDTYLSPIEFTLHAPNENEFWRIVPKAEGAKISVVKNTADQIQFKITNITPGYEFIGFSTRQHYKQHVNGITYEWDEAKGEGLITFDIPDPSLDSGLRVYENCQIDALAIFRNTSEDKNYYEQNEDFRVTDGQGGEYDAIRNNNYVDVKSGKHYHIKPIIANWPIRQWSEAGNKIAIFQIGNIDEGLFSGDVVGMNPDYVYIFFNEKELDHEVYNYGFYTCVQFRIDLTLEEFKNGRLDILIEPLSNKNNAKFNTTLIV